MVRHILPPLLQVREDLGTKSNEHCNRLHPPSWEIRGWDTSPSFHPYICPGDFCLHSFKKYLEPSPCARPQPSLEPAHGALSPERRGPSQPLRLLQTLKHFPALYLARSSSRVKECKGWKVCATVNSGATCARKGKGRPRRQGRYLKSRMHFDGPE